MEIPIDEWAQEVLTAARPRWLAQRDASRLPSRGEEHDLHPLICGALRYLTSSDLVQLLTERVASARHLPSVLATRLRKVIATHRKLYNVKVDDHGERYAALRDERRRAASRRTTASHDAIRRARADIAIARAATERKHTTPIPTGAGFDVIAPPHQTHQRSASSAERIDAELRAWGLPTVAEQEAAARTRQADARHTTAIRRARLLRAQQHEDPAVP